MNIHKLLAGYAVISCDQSIPENKSPILDDNPCDIKQSGSFFYLVGTFDGSAATFDKNDPAFNTLDNVKKQASEVIDGAENLQASVDGVPISHIDKLRAQSPPFKLKVPDNNAFGIPADTYIAVSDGFWVALKPLGVGQHTIHFGGSAPDLNFKVDVTYHITIK